MKKKFEKLKKREKRENSSGASCSGGQGRGRGAPLILSFLHLFEDRGVSDKKRNVEKKRGEFAGDQQVVRTVKIGEGGGRKVRKAEAKQVTENRHRDRL